MRLGMPLKHAEGLRKNVLQTDREGSMDDESQACAAARWFEEAAAQIADEILALLEAKAKSDCPLLPRQLAMALHRSALEKAEAGLTRLAGLGYSPPADTGGAEARGTAQHGPSAQKEGTSQDLSARTTEKRARRTKAVAEGPARRAKASRRHDAPGQMDLVDFLTDQECN